MDNKTIITIVLFIYLGLVINFFRWSKNSEDGRTGTWVFTIVAGIFAVLFPVTIVTVNTVETLISPPEVIDYGTIQGNNFIYYKWKKDDKIKNIDWINNIEETKKQKYYQLQKYNIIGCKVGNSWIERK